MSEKSLKQIERDLWDQVLMPKLQISSDISSIATQNAMYDLVLGRQNGKTHMIHKWIEENVKEKENSMFWRKNNPLVGKIEVAPAEKVTNVEEEWIWVDGYKGTQADMTCNGYQYIMNQQHNMADDEEIVECRSGFHLCLKLIDVFNYYDIGNGRRYFKVRALVRKSDFETYGAYHWCGRNDKLVAKSIIFERELTPDEIFANNLAVSKWSQEDKLLALEHNIEWVFDRNRTNELVKLGYSEPMAAYFVDHSLYDKAYALGTQDGVSMEMKIFAIMAGRA